MAFAPGGSKLATAGGDGAAVWSLSGDRLVSMTGHGRMESVVFSPDGEHLATGGSDGTARVWDVATGEQTLVLRGHSGPVIDVAFSPDGTRLATVSDDGTLRVYAIRYEELVGIARARLSRGLSDAECRQYLHLPACPPSTSPEPSPPSQPRTAPAGGPEGAYRVYGRSRRPADPALGARLVVRRGLHVEPGGRHLAVAPRPDPPIAVGRQLQRRMVRPVHGVRGQDRPGDGDGW